MAKEWAQTADDVLWRRSKLGLRLTRGAGRHARSLHGGAAVRARRSFVKFYRFGEP